MHSSRRGLNPAAALSNRDLGAGAGFDKIFDRRHNERKTLFKHTVEEQTVLENAMSAEAVGMDQCASITTGYVLRRAREAQGSFAQVRVS